MVLKRVGDFAGGIAGKFSGGTGDLRAGYGAMRTQRNTRPSSSGNSQDLVRNVTLNKDANYKYGAGAGYKYGEGSGKKLSGAEQKYGTASRRDFRYMGNNADEYFNSGSTMERAGKAGNHMRGNMQTAAIEGGHGSILGMAGHHAVRGALGGGVVSGTMEAAQGGSFWDGAADGMMKGAIGYGGYRMGMSGVGATSVNPFSKNGIVKSAGNMRGSYFGAGEAALSKRQTTGLAQATMNGPNVSKAVEKTVQHRQTTGLAEGIMNQ